MARPDSISSRRWLFILLVLAAAVFVPLFSDEISTLWALATADQSPPALFAAILIILPALGFPLAPLLILLGGRFDWPTGLTALVLVVPFHLLAAFWVTRKILYRRLLALAARRGLDPNALSRKGSVKAGLVLMAFPGLSYSLKNHLLPLSGLPAWHCLALAWPVQVLFGFPFVIFGSAASNWSLPLMAGAALLAVLLLVLSGPAVRIFRRSGSAPSESSEKENRS